MNEIGGYNPLEIGSSKELLHENGVFLNSGRNCLSYVVQARKIKKIHVPFYICKWSHRTGVYFATIKN